MHCLYCGRRLLHAAASVKTRDGTAYAGPTCARRAGLLPPVVPRGPLLFTRYSRGSRKNPAQGELQLQA